MLKCTVPERASSLNLENLKMKILCISQSLLSILFGNVK